MGEGDTVTLALAGDVMTGRGIDQILPWPCEPTLHEPYVTSAGQYVALAEAEGAPLPRRADLAYPWGDALEALDRRRPDVRIVNLETALTRSADPAPEKGIHYRTSPENGATLARAGIHACTLANNHVLDWGPEGLQETLDTLEGLGIAQAGAGRDRTQAAAPATLPLPGGGRLLVFARGFASAGVPPGWAASERRSGVAFVPEASEVEASRLAEKIQAVRRPGDLVVVSLHWGPNWGYRVPGGERAFAHRLVEQGVADVIHGHSSHHPRPPEVRGRRPILYGCGDFLNDYEGIGGRARYRPELVALWLPTLARADGALVELSVIPFRIHRFRLERALAEDAAWLRETLVRKGRRLGTRLEVGEEDDGPVLRWGR